MIVSKSEPMEAKVVRLLSKALQPPLTHVSVNWGVLQPLLMYPTAPSTLPPLYQGSRAMLFAIVDPTKLTSEFDFGLCQRFQ